MEATGDVSKLDTLRDSKGREQPSTKPKRASANAEPARDDIGTNGARAIMASRQEPADSLDYFPTPPFATRASPTQPAAQERELGGAVLSATEIARAPGESRDPPEIIEIVTAKVTSGEVSDVMVKKMIEQAKPKTEEEQTNKHKAERRSRLSKSRRQRQERREHAWREAEERRRKDLAQAVTALIDKIGIENARTVCVMSDKVGSCALIEALRVKIENPSEERPAASTTIATFSISSGT
jgi:hypothetical protein